MRRPHRLFLEEVESLIGDEERRAFSTITRDYQRDRFIERFWRIRDPYPQTPRNEFRERWEEHAEIARQRFSDITDPRAQMILLFGAEKRHFRANCLDVLVPLDIWYFDSVPGVRPDFHLVFERLGGERVRLWNPRDGLATLLAMHVTSPNPGDSLVQQVQQKCIRGDDIIAALFSSADWQEVANRTILRPEAESEWVQSFLSRTTDLPEGAAALAATVSWDYPGTHQSRTVVQLMMSVERSAAQIATLGERQAYNFLVDGEILRQGEFFENFRYKFNLPVPQNESEAPIDRLPLAVQRYLRLAFIPGWCACRI